MRFVLAPFRLSIFLVRAISGGLLCFVAMVLRRPAVPPRAVAITHSRTIRILLWISLPADTIGFFILGYVLGSRVPAAGPYVTGFGIFAFMFVLALASELTRTPHYVTTQGVTIRADRRKSWTIPSESIANVGWSPSAIDRSKAVGDVAVLDPMAQMRIDLKEGHRVPGLPEGTRTVWFGADDKRAADQIRRLCLTPATVD